MLIQKPYLDVQFQLEHGSADFSVGDDIKGTAFIIPRKSISPHQLSIYLEGKVKIQIDRTENAVPLPPYTACQTFLRIEQPLVLKSSTDSGLLQGGLRHEIPFGFTVPPRIRGSVQEEHSLLPPSIGQDDITPSEISVEYNIKLSLTRGINRDGMPAVAEWAFPLFIRSPRIEEAPLLVPEDSKHYCLSKEKFVSKSPISFSRIGALLARTAQPAAIQQAKAMVSYLPVNLQFQAISRPHLPQLSSIISRDFNPEPVGVGKVPIYRGSGFIHGQHRIRDNLWYLSKGANQAAGGSELAAYVQLLSCFPNILFDGDSPIPHIRAMEPND
ncbi:uncharacterized protein BO88DRAFT_470840 [Aspergillus vadensis CBS 113365]|uniref:Arrestin-like N-terminal domain-containing protein n=1 Tax=Aspergillus vadensis (strain CBS 113365 / IMI 142717 / IBT 24658) TaxID=1448311 RepID=A0A319AZH1_ASPVC|nr:hypothetical protein BO88DRAFT_470840 [Aspergillus vadensis CBS 113365]PYH65707.1 hypothetical protein BO88DRAFT_470840 [Aspergillus vadensis CBS 113365]